MSVLPLNLFQVPGHWRTDHRALPPHLLSHGCHGDPSTPSRPESRQQRPLPVLQFQCHSAPGCTVGGPSVERSGVTQQVPGTHLRARTVVLLHLTYQAEPLRNLSPGVYSLVCEEKKHFPESDVRHWCMCVVSFLADVLWRRWLLHSFDDDERWRFNVQADLTVKHCVLLASSIHSERDFSQFGSISSQSL